MRINPTKLCQIELQVRDIAAALAFYHNVFGWQEAPVEIHGLHLLSVPEHCPWGISLIPVASNSEIMSAGARQVLYFHVDKESLQNILSLCESAGGRLLRKHIPTPGYGLISQIEDPDGHRWGLVETES